MLELAFSLFVELKRVKNEKKCKDLGMCILESLRKEVFDGHD